MGTRCIKGSVRSNLTREFVDKVKREIIVDTAKYRYVAFVYDGIQYIKRIEKYKLDTTAVYTDWELLHW